MTLLQCSVDVPTLERGSAAAQVRLQIAGDTTLRDLPSLLAASRELCGAVATQKLGRTTVHARPQASGWRLDGAVPGTEVESRIRPNTGSPPPGRVFFRGGESWAFGQTPPPHRLHRV